jgi:hypothetical protein
LTPEQFEEFILPHLEMGTRGPQPKLDSYVMFNHQNKWVASLIAQSDLVAQSFGSTFTQNPQPTVTKKRGGKISL